MGGNHDLRTIGVGPPVLDDELRAASVLEELHEDGVGAGRKLLGSAPLLRAVQPVIVHNTLLGCGGYPNSAVGPS